MAHILFVGTKKQAQEAIKTEAERCGMYYVNERWLRRYAYQLQDHPEQNQADSTKSKLWKRTEHFDVLPKKEVIKLKERMEKLEKNLGGIKDMKKFRMQSSLLILRRKESAYRKHMHLGIPSDRYR